jgi:hypothetical protein
MLQAHSFLWHYLWLAPHILQVGLAVWIWRRGLHKLFPVFLAYAIFEAIEEFTLYGMDVLPWVKAETFWRAFWVGLIIEGLIKFALIGELFLHLLRSWPALAKLGSWLIRGTGAVLVLLATLAAAYAPIDNPQYSFISRAHILQQTLYIIECGLILFLFLFAAHFELTWNRRTFGIALGLGILSCEHMGTWAVMASGALLDKRHLLDFLNMATYHVCVLIWFYYFLIPQRSATTSVVPLPEHNLEIWNQELERLLHQ